MSIRTGRKAFHPSPSNSKPEAPILGEVLFALGGMRRPTPTLGHGAAAEPGDG